MKTLLVTAAAVLWIAAAPEAQAQWAVFDASNFSQNILTASRTLQQINNQIRQLQNEAQMLDNQRRNLTGLDFNSLNQLRLALSTSTRLLQEAQGIAFSVSQMESDFARLYPSAYSKTISGNQMALDAIARWRNALEALRTATRMQAQVVSNFAVDEKTLNDLITRSQAAVGQLQATQATNQLLALQAKQAITEQQLRIAQDRAVAMEQARQVAAQERARELRVRFQGQGSRYTPATVHFYNNPGATR